MMGMNSTRRIPLGSAGDLQGFSGPAAKPIRTMVRLDAIGRYDVRRHRNRIRRLAVITAGLALPTVAFVTVAARRRGRDYTRSREYRALVSDYVM
jgi:hypothetical protein